MAVHQHVWVLVVCLFTIRLTEGQSSFGYYSIVAPKVLRPNTDYHVAVTTQGTGRPTQVLIEVGGKQDSGGTFQTSQVTTVQPFATQIVKLEIGDLGPGTYNLTTRGSGGLDFTNSTSLQYIHKSYSVFVQTDKAVYKPGQKVLFRAVVLNAHLKPSVTGALDIYITDGKGNRVKQWNRALTTKGVFSGELQLSEHPVLGDWKITVTVLDQVFEKMFQVAEYVLPKFEVTIDTPKHATFKDAKIYAGVKAKYTYGKAVKGEATITAYPVFYSRFIQPVFETPVRKVVPIDGKAVVDFDIAAELKLNDDYERMIQVDVTVEESLTGRRQNTSAQIILHKYKYKMELIKTSEYFKPGLKYTAFIKLAYHDGTPVKDLTNPIIVKSGFTYDHDKYTETKYKLPEDGLLELDFYPPVHNVTVIGIEARYLDLTEWFSTVSSSMSPSNTFIQILSKTESPRVNQDVEIEVISTEQLRYFNYKVLGRGDIITAGTQLASSENTKTFRFLATYAMAPTAHVLVYYIKDDGEVVADALDINIEGVLQNFVNIETNPTETQPASSVDFSIQAKPNSYVGILGVDQSVLLLKGGNDISLEQVMDEMHTYDYATPYLPYRGRIRRSYFWPGSATAKKVFDNCGAVIITNGLLHDNDPFIYYRSNFELLESMEPMDKVIAPEVGFAARSEVGFVKEENIRLRQNFPETWLWESVDAGYDGRANLRRTVPDTITSWVITGFSVDPLNGLGLIETPKKVKVFRPFFVSIDLPYSVIRGEIVAIPVVVFNYMDKDLVADVIIKTDGDFEFSEVSNDVNYSPNLDPFRKKTITVKSNSGASTSFMITPKTLGYIDIKVTATSALAGDAVDRKLLVKAEGQTQYVNKVIFIDLNKEPEFKANVSLDIPSNIAHMSEFIEVSAVGDILGSSIRNLDNLIQMPYGCGEQNMLNFVPNIVAIEYLTKQRQLTPAIENKAIKYIETGYQQELTYRHDDGSFSAFGKSDPNGSTWLTAFVAKSFRQATNYISIEDKIIQDALHWLENNQAANGSFPEVGHVSHRAMQGGAANGLALTAYTLIAFVENQKTSPLYRNTISKAVDYIAKNLDGLDDAYALAICSYALHLADHPSKDQAFHLLENKAQGDGDVKYWKNPPSDEKNPWNDAPNPVSVEMTAYALLTYISRGLVQDSWPIMKWLLTQRNEQGGFASTQDTVIGIFALAKLGEKISAGNVDLEVTFSYDAGSRAQTTIRVDQQKVMMMQKNELPRSVRHVDISARGRGFAVAQVSYRYNINVTGAWPLFTLDPQVDKNSDMNHLQLSICSGFIGTKDTNESNMAIMEVTLPSGFTVDSDSLPSLEVSQHVRRVETKDGDSVVMLYFDKLTKEEYCPTVSAFRTHKVAQQKPVPVTVYDYYDTTRRARVFYEARVATLCDICEGEDCAKSCSNERRTQSGKQQGNESTNDTSSARSNVRLLAIFFVLLAKLNS